MDKKNRALFREMDDFSKIDMVWPFLKTKVDELGLGSVATQALEKWRSDVMSMPQFAERPLNVCPPDPYSAEGLRRLRLVDLCSCPILPHDVVERTYRLLSELRTLQPASS